MRHAWMLLALLACASGPAGEDPTETWAFAVAERSCAPWDGAATMVTLTNTADPPSAATPALRLAAWQGPAAVGGHTFEVAAPGTDGGTATYCQGGDCTAATTGWIRFGPGTGPLTGRYSLTFPDGTRRIGSFSALLVARQALCG